MASQQLTSGKKKKKKGVGTATDIAHATWLGALSGGKIGPGNYSAYSQFSFSLILVTLF